MRSRKRRNVHDDGSAGKSVGDLDATGGRGGGGGRRVPVGEGHRGRGCSRVADLLQISIVRHQQAAVDDQPDDPAENGQQEREEHEDLSASPRADSSDGGVGQRSFANRSEYVPWKLALHGFFLVSRRTAKSASACSMGNIHRRLQLKWDGIGSQN